MKLRIGLIGFGSWTRSAYLPALKRDGRADIAAVTASSQKTKDLALHTLGEQITIYDTYEDLLTDKTLDAVMIAVPDSVHQSALTAALAVSIPVFYEPPISHLRSEIPGMIYRLLSSKQVTFANLELGYHPVIKEAAHFIQAKEIGELQKVTLTLNADFGCTIDSDLCLPNRMSCWYVDVLNQLVGTIPDRVLLLDGFGVPGRMQYISTAIYDYQGVFGFFQLDVSRKDGVSIEVDAIGDLGRIHVDYFTGTLSYYGNGRKPDITKVHNAQTPYASYPGVHESISAFLDAVLTNDSAHGNAVKVALLNQIGFALEESKDTKEWAAVPK